MVGQPAGGYNLLYLLLDHSKLGHELSSEVTSSRQLSSQLRKRTLTIMKMFQHKLHRVMMQSVRLYADNLVSMDVCGWSITGAKQILGDTVSVLALSILLIVVL